jgi:hypothetical protein
MTPGLYWSVDSDQFDMATMDRGLMTIVNSALDRVHALDATLNVDAASKPQSTGVVAVRMCEMWRGAALSPSPRRTP